MLSIELKITSRTWALFDRLLQFLAFDSLFPRSIHPFAQFDLHGPHLPLSPSLAGPTLFHLPISMHDCLQATPLMCKAAASVASGDDAEVRLP